MKVFSFGEIKEAEAYSLSGKAALHLHNVCFDRSPKCFRDAVFNRQECIAHFLDQDKNRLVSRCRALGVRVIVVEHEGRPWQHVDLCGRPLARLILEHYNRLLALERNSAAIRLMHLLFEYKGSRGWYLQK